MKHRVILQLSGGGGGGGLFKSVVPGAKSLPEDPVEAAKAEPEGSDVLAAVALDPAYKVEVERDLTEPSPMLFKSVGGAPGPVQLGGSHIVRGEVDEADLPRVLQAARRSAAVNVFADPGIAPFLICGGSPPLGTAVDVATRLGFDTLQQVGMDGTGVRVAIVDTGFNLPYLRSLGVQAGFDPQLSWTLPGGPTPGMQQVEHGTMSAFDATIAAPRCTLLDYPVLGQPSGMSTGAPGGPPMMVGLLSDALLAYNRLLEIARAEPGVPLVVNNSWGMFNPSWDWPIGSPGNYSDNPRHPFNLIVAALDRAGADIVFASGDCGAACPDARCGGVTNVIYGANSSRSVLCVAGVDITGQWVGYSTQGPGLLENLKPDVAGFTHFRGSGVYPADSGTSAAAPVVSGLLAAVRTRVPPTDRGVEPSALRDAVRGTAWRAGPPGFDYNLGWGVVNGPGLVTQLSRAAWDQAAPQPALAGAGGGGE